jgi:hypothetical protein
MNVSNEDNIQERQSTKDRQCKVKKTKDEQWNLIYANIRGIKGKRASLIEILENQKPQIVLLTETLLKTDMGMKLEGYTFFGKSRQTQGGGRTGILVKNGIRASVAPHTSDRGIKLIWISIKKKTVPPFLLPATTGNKKADAPKNRSARRWNCSRKK